MNKFFGCLFVLSLFSLHTLDAVEVQLVSTDRDLLSKHLVSVKLVLNHHEKAVYKKSLQFSFDDADIVVMQWKSLSEPITEYMHHTKRTEQVFKEVTYFEIGISDQSELSKKLEDRSTLLNLFVSCIVLSQHEQIMARTIQVPLMTKIVHDRNAVLPASSLINYAAPADVLVLQEDASNQGNKALLFAESIDGLLAQIKIWLHKNIQHLLLSMLSAFIGLGILLFCVRRNWLVRSITRELLVFLAMLGCNGMLFFITIRSRASLFFIIVGLCNTAMSWYCVRRSNHSLRLVQVSYTVIACIIAATVLPFFIQASLLLW